MKLPVAPSKAGPSEQRRSAVFRSSEILLLSTVAIGLSSLALSSKSFRWPWQEVPTYRALLKYDPPLGSAISIPAEDAFGRRIPPQPILLVYAGSCHGCTYRAFAPQKLATDTNMVFLYNAATADLPSELKSLGKGRYVLAGGSDLAPRLNPLWAPRFYVLDEHRRLRFLTRSPRELPAGVIYED